jgi:hypothetical protein
MHYRPQEKRDRQPLVVYLRKSPGIADVAFLLGAVL